MTGQSPNQIIGDGRDPIVHGPDGAMQLRFCDVVNSVPDFGFNLRSFVNWRIQRFQRRTLGKTAFIKSTHTRLYVGKGTLVEFTWPKAQFVKWTEIADGNLRVLRYRRCDWSGVPEAVRQAVLTVAMNYIGKRYDLLELVRFLVSEAAGNNVAVDEVLRQVIDGGQDNMVCSTFAATLYRVARNEANVHGFAVPKLFGGLPVELTTPAHFDNAPHDFELIHNYETDL